MTITLNCNVKPVVDSLTQVIILRLIVASPELGRASRPDLIGHLITASYAKQVV
jgi:hypothetical protein